MKNDAAAGPWIRWNYTEGSTIQPQAGEWCLWSMVINGERNQFSGSWFEYRGQKRLSWQGGGWYPMTGEIFWARVNHPPA